jgi:hypothetical protein
MNKQTVLEYLRKHIGGTNGNIAKQLGYANPNCISNFDDPIPPKTMDSIVRRMKAAGIKVPKVWG